MRTPLFTRGIFTFYDDGTYTPAISGGDGEDTPPAPADDAEVAELVGLEGLSADDITALSGLVAETAPEGPVEFVLPEDVSTFDDDRLVALNTTIEEQATTLRTDIAARQAEGTASIADVNSLRSLRAAQASIATLLEGRVAERTQVAEALAADAPVELPADLAVPSRAAAAAVVRRTISENAPSTNQSDAERTASADAAPVEQPMPWRSTLAAGQTADWADMVNESRIASGKLEPSRPVILASARVISDDERERMLTDSAGANERIIAQAMQDHREARMEAGGGARMAAICDPATILRDAFVCGTTATPLQSSLVQLTANSGNALKYQYRLPTSISEAHAGVGTWSTALQGAIDPTDPDTWKPSVNIACATYATETAVEQTAGYEVDAYTELSSPESVADFEQAKDRAFARQTEGWYLRKLDTFLHHVTWNAIVGAGAVPETIEAILTALANGTYDERLDPNTGYTVYGSPGLLYALTADENRKGYRTGAAALSDVEQIVEQATGTDYVQLLDVAASNDAGAWGTSPFAALPAVGGGGVALARLDTLTWVLRVIDPSAFVAFNTGEAVFGQQVTLDQARQNKRGFFQRMFGGLMKPGCAPGFKITITNLAVDGSRGGFLTPDAETGGS